jgi:hypothetical protein
MVPGPISQVPVAAPRASTSTLQSTRSSVLLRPSTALSHLSTFQEAISVHGDVAARGKRTPAARYRWNLSAQNSCTPTRPAPPVPGSATAGSLRALFRRGFRTATQQFKYGCVSIRRDCANDHRACGTLERWDEPNDKTILCRRCRSRHLGRRPMRPLQRWSRSQVTSRGRSSTWTTPNFRGCAKQLPSRPIAVIKARPRTKRRPGRHQKANLRRSAIGS